MIVDGFNLTSPLVCEGIIGDGCGGGRIFFIEDNNLYTYDPTTKQKQMLLGNTIDVVEIQKSGCIITINTKSDIIFFDLQSLQIKH